MNKLTKKQADYIKPPPKDIWPSENKGILCGTCKYFSSKKKACSIVKSNIHSLS